MATEKVSLTLEEELLAEAREVVGARGLSTYVNRALRHQLQHDRLAGLLAELEREQGPIDPQVIEEVRRAWPAPGERTAKRRSA
jgi:Arc/MetJ family transcription regulator